MSDRDNNPVRMEQFTAKECGWLRRPEKDTPTIDVWEKPDGILFAGRKNVMPMMWRLPWVEFGRVYRG